LLILGDPGSGKSTFINYLAYLMAQIVLVEEPAAWLAEQLAAWHHDFHLPIKIELRALAGQLAGVKKGEAHLILTHLHESLQSWRLEDCWPLLDQAIRSKDAPLLVLLDGLDEASTVLRPVLVQAVQDFVTRYPQHRYVVTCRPYAYVGQPWQLNGFTNVTLAPFNTEQIEQFTITWYRELAGRGGLSPLQAGEKARQLQEALRRNDLRELAPRPLLLTVMTLLHTFRGKLPEDRTELYADAVDLLLRRWEQRIGGEAGLLEQLNIPGLKMSTLEEGLYKVAFQAHSAPGAAPGQTADISEADLRAWLAPYLGQSWDKAGDFIAYIRERAGLLVRHKTEAYTFPHRTFQEFLAACHLVVQPDYPGQAARLARTEPDRWREVFILAAGHATRTHRLSLAIASVNDLCPAALEETARPDAAAFRRAMLAGETLLEIGLNGLQREEAGQAVLKRIRSWLAAAMRADRQLKPVERAAAGNVLARLGDLRPGVGLRSDGLPDITWRPVPAGPFRMGSDKKKDRSAEEAEFPQHEVNLPAYQISLYPVTNAHYGVFVADGGYTDKWRRCWTKAGSDWKGNRTEPDQYGDPFDLPNHPLVGVSWYEAVAFCHWLTLRFREAGELGPEQVVRLPSEAEWEKAARGPAGRIYPWGDQPDPNRANDGETGLAATSPVGCFPGGLSPYQCEEMAGNVWEWCLTKWQDNYKGYRDNNELEGQAVRVLRGGSWLGGQNGARCAVRYWDSPNFRLRSGGFRLVVSAIF
jgi:formylglycine-generating enzyme required for sulfatase activity